MISHKNKFIFIHIPKTAGTTIRASMRGEYDQLHNPHHATMFQLKKLLPEKTFQTYFKFAFVRNPYARQVSIWEYSHKIVNMYEKSGKNHRSELEKNYQVCLEKTKFKNFKAFCARPVQYDYSYYYRDPNTDKVLLDFFGKVENLQEDFNIACDKIGIPRRQLSHLNKTNHKHYSKYYDEETKRIVAERYAKDIEYFGYKFDP